MLINRQGSTRIVFLVGRYAIKVPNFLDGIDLFRKGLLANTVEAKISKGKACKLCPVIARLPFGLLLVMPRAIPLKREDADRYNLEGLFPGCNDLKFNNFGWLKGKIVMLDYAGKTGE